jgi:hypothetical protein
MAEPMDPSLPPSDGSAAPSPGSATEPLRALLVTVAIVIGAALLGLAGGLVWSAIAPEALFVVTGRGVAYVVNPETNAFIAADGWFSVVAVVGGVIIGLIAYLFGVRRHGPLPAAGALVGATAAGFLAWWVGRNIGLSAFRHQLGVSKNGALLRQPIDLGAHGALTFWPLAAGAVIGGIELMLAMRDRQRRTRPAVPVTDASPGRGPADDRSLFEQQ